MRFSPTALTGLALAALVAATLGTVALADRGDHAGGPGGPGMMMPEFSELDANGDGQVTPEEVDAFRTARAAQIDSDGDGKVSLTELTAAETARAADRAQRMMQARDADGDGFLTAAEMMLPPAPGRMFDRIDQDGDGQISAEEYEAAKRFMAERGGRHHRGPMGEEGPEGN